MPAVSIEAYKATAPWSRFGSIMPIADAEIDGIFYAFNDNTMEAIVTTGDTKYTGSVTIPETITYNNMTYSVTSIGRYAFFNCSGLTSVTIPNSVRSIGECAFGDCSSLTFVTIGSGVISIDAYAFSSCSSLIKVIVPDIAAWCGISFGDNPLLYAHHLYVDEKTEIKDLVIPEGVTDIGNSAFSGCSGLTSLTIPNSVTSIGNSAFNGCNGLTSINIPEGVSSIGNGAFYGCSSLTSVTFHCKKIDSWFRGKTSIKEVIIGDEVTSIGNEAFYGCSGLTSVTIGSGVTSIGKNAFEGCSGLTSITIPQSIKSIGSNAFAGCYFVSDSFVNNSSLNRSDNWGAILCDEETSDGVLIKNNVAIKCRPWATSATIPNSVTSIGDNAFYGCSSLTSVTIPNSVTYIGQYAFYDCSGLTSVTIGNSVTSIRGFAFRNCPNLTEIHISDIVAWCEIDFEIGPWVDVFSWDHGYHLFLNDEEIKDLVIPDGATKVGVDAFRCFTSLTSVTIPGSVKTLCEGAFSRCSGLTSVNMTEGLTTIGNYAFDYCSSLTSITIPSSVTNIGNYAFQYCTDLTDVICYATRPPYASYNTFDNSHYENTTLHVPGGYIKFYKSSWSKFKSIKPIDGLDNYANLDGISYVFTENNAEVSYADEAYSGDAVIPESVTHNGKTYNVTCIGESAFSGCSGLTSVIIPNSVTSIGRSAFSGCSGLTSVTIGNSVTSIGEMAFYDCSGLTAVIIGNSVTSIGHAVFSGCSGLTAVIIPNSVTSIGGSAFSGCSGLTAVTIPNSVTSIDYYAFRDCISMTSVTIGSGVTSIGESAFSGCSGLKSVHITDLAAWCKIYFSDPYSNPLYYANHLFMDGKEITDLVIPNSVTEIGALTFQDCSSLTSVTIGNSVTSIGKNAFYGCTALSSVTLESNAIASATRTPTTSMKTIFGEQVQTYILGDAVTSIGAYAFYGCKALTDVYCYAENVPSAKSNTFNSSPVASATLHVPAASIEAYKTTSPWSKFGTIVAITEAIAEETTVNPAETAKPGSATTTEDVTTSLGDDDEVDPEEGSITMHTTMSTEEVQTLIENSKPGLPGFNEGFKGVYFQLAAGKGKIELDIETQGNYMMSVMQGNRLVGNYAQSTKGTITIEYDIDADTWFFAYPAVSTPSGIRRANAADTEGALKVYSIRIVPEEIYDPDGIRTIDNEQLTIDDAEYYDLNGRKLSAPQKGINIIRYSDGTSKKVLIK